MALLHDEGFLDPFIHGAGMRYGILTVAMLLGCSSVAHSRDDAVTSWRKLNNSFENFRHDAVECAKTGYFRDVSQDAPAKSFLRGFRTADDNLNNPDGIDVDSWFDTILRTQPSRKMKEVHRVQVSNVESCLTEKGYAKFTLNKSEARELRSKRVAQSRSRVRGEKEIPLRFVREE